LEIFLPYYFTGGGSQGCNSLYQLAKRGCKAVLLERSKLTSGTTWHTAGLGKTNHKINKSLQLFLTFTES